MFGVIIFSGMFCTTYYLKMHIFSINNVTLVFKKMIILISVENPPKPNRNEESPDLLKNTSPGIYKALVPSKVSIF